MDFVHDQALRLRRNVLMRGFTRHRDCSVRLTLTLQTLLPAKTTKLAPEHAICVLAHLEEDLTHS